MEEGDCLEPESICSLLSARGKYGNEKVLQLSDSTSPEVVHIRSEVLRRMEEGDCSEPESVCSLPSAQGEHSDEKEAKPSDSTSPGRSEATAATPKEGLRSQFPPPLSSTSPLHEAAVGGSSGAAGGQSRHHSLEVVPIPTIEKDPTCEELVPGDHKELEFEVTVEKSEGQKFGADVLRRDRALVITRIMGGPIAAWNEAHPDRCVEPGDQIVEVNGYGGNSDFLSGTITSEMSLRIRIRRLLEFSVSINKKEGSLGIDVFLAGRSLQISLIRDGLVHDWNAQTMIERRVGVSDYVVEVNGLRGTAAELVTAVQGSERMELVVRRGSSKNRLGVAAPTVETIPAPSTHAAVEDHEVYSQPKGDFVVIDIRD